MPPAFRVRRATADDAAILARHRAEMFRAMGQLTPKVYPLLCQEAERYFIDAVPAGTYIAWLATPVDEPDTVIAGAGVQLRLIVPRPDRTGARLLTGEQGLVLNVFTEVSWRRRGVAEALMRDVLDWAKERRLPSLVLHASAEGRRLYEKLGFAGTNEMQYMGELGGNG